MLLTPNQIQDIGKQRVIGFWGAPPQEILKAEQEKWGLPFLDLDVYYGAPQSRIAPEAYCHIIRNCIDNAVALGDRLVCVVAATGAEKCDAGRYAAWLVEKATGAKVIRTTNEGSNEPGMAFLSEANGSLKMRAIRIMRSIIEPLTSDEEKAAVYSRCTPTHGFWGTPPHPIELLDLFPDSTHIFGWTRCVDQGRPADLELEMAVPANLPIVFYSQGFCPKAQLARYLAKKHRGMHVDTHDAMGAATRAKIEAFIRLARPEALK